MLENMLNTLRRSFPWLFYIGLLQRSIDNRPKILVDIGCGSGETMRHLKKVDKGTKLGKTYIVGFEIFESYMCDAHEIYDDTVRCDVRLLPLKRQSADVVFCLDLMEHLEKQDGLNLLQSLEDIATKQILVFTPRGWIPQEEFENNIWQKHRSAWLPKEFEKLNFRILGVSGIGNIYGKKCEYKSRTPLLRPLFHFMRLISQPIALHKNHLAYQVLCIKNKVKQNGQCNKES